MKRSLLPVQNSNVWSLADQALVSGCNFFIGVSLARSLGLEGFGSYAIAQTYLLYANTFQSALVVSPMMTAIPLATNEKLRRSLVSGFFGYALVVIFSTLLTVQALAASLGLILPAISLGEMTFALAAAMLSFLFQDWLRKASYARSMNRTVFVADCLAYGGQLCGIGLSIFSATLTPKTAVWILALSFFASTVWLLAATRPTLNIRATIDVLKEHWRASLNFLLSWQLQWGASSGVILLGSGIVGQQAAGAIRAVQNLLGPVNVIFQWMDNVIPVKSAVKLSTLGKSALASFLLKIGTTGVLIIGAFTALLMLFDEKIIITLYGEEYRPFAILIVFQALYYLVGHVYRMGSYYHRTIGDIKPLVIASAWWAGVALLIAILFVSRHSERGIMMAMVLGETAGLVYLIGRHIRAPVLGTHCVIRRSDGSERLLIPMAHRSTMRSAIAMYFPSRWTGYVYRWGMVWLLPIQAFLRIVERKNLTSSNYPHVDAVLHALPQTRPDLCAVLVGAPGPHSKLTLKLMDDTAQVLGYGRLAYAPAAIGAVRNEADVLAVLHKRGLGRKIPHILAQGDFNDPEAYYLIESAGPDNPAESALTRSHFDFLAHLLAAEHLDWKNIVESARSEIQTVVEGSSWQEACLEFCEWLARQPLAGIPSCVEHGDFAPWNIRVHSDGELFVFDWEFARSQGLPWLDAIHFEFQLSVLVRRETAEQSSIAMLRPFDMEESATYRQCMPSCGEHALAFAGLYVVRRIVLNHEEGQGLDSNNQRALLSVMVELIRMRNGVQT